MIFLETIDSRACLSANIKDKTAVSQQLAAVLILYTYKLPDNPSPIQMRLYHRKSKGGNIMLPRGSLSRSPCEARIPISAIKLDNQVFAVSTPHYQISGVIAKRTNCKKVVRNLCR